MSRIFVTGDVHGGHDIKKLTNKKFPENKDLTKDDYVIVAGDFGLLWNNSPEEIHLRNWLTYTKNFTTLWVDGNHENFNMLNNYKVEEWNGGKVHKISDSIIHLIRGEIYTIHGKKFFIMGGAESVDKEHRVENVSWWKEELPSWKEYENGISNLEAHSWDVDYIITHTCPLEIFDTVVENNKVTTDLEKYLEMVSNTSKYKHWYFGHFHQDKKIDNKHTVIYNKIIELEWED